MPARKPKKTAFHEGKEAQKRFDSMMDAVLSVPKDKILELEKAEREKKSAAKKIGKLQKEQLKRKILLLPPLV